ncbi:MAG: glutathione peroxidase [Anaeromyxobacter sp.]
MLPLALSLALVAGGAPVGVHAFQVKANDGSEVSLSRYAGKVLLVVNTASECGYTPQYKGLEELYQAYRARGLEVLAFPSNDFGRQEPGSDAEIKKFCELKYRTTFPLFAKVPVKGKDAIPLYQHLAAEGRGAPDWNFNKYLVDASGKVLAHYPSDVEPMSSALRKAIEAALPAGR